MMPPPSDSPPANMPTVTSAPVADFWPDLPFVLQPDDDDPACRISLDRDPLGLYLLIEYPTLDQGEHPPAQHRIGHWDALVLSRLLRVSP